MHRRRICMHTFYVAKLSVERRQVQSSHLVPDAKEGLLDNMSFMYAHSLSFSLSLTHTHTCLYMVIIYLFIYFKTAFWRHSCKVHQSTGVKLIPGEPRALRSIYTRKRKQKKKSDATEEQLVREAFQK